MLKNKHFLILLILALVVVLSCQVTPQIQIATPGQEVVNTAMANIMKTLTAQSKTGTPATKTPTSKTPNKTASQSVTPVEALPSKTPTSTPPLTITPYTPFPPIVTYIPYFPLCNQARFVADITVRDNTLFSPGTQFTKTWRLRNVGYCAWNPNYRVIFVGGNLMEGPTSIALPGYVLPGESIDISITFRAPYSAGVYQGYWKLQTPAGEVFGIGSSGNSPFWVKIVVDYIPGFAVTSMTVVSSPSTVTGTCVRTIPQVINFTAYISANMAGQATYFWERSDGWRSDLRTLTYTKASTIIVADNWTLGALVPNTTLWERIYIDNPNHQYFGSAYVTIACTP